MMMEKAIELANNVEGEIPVAAVIVKDGTVISSAVNCKEKDADVTAHADCAQLNKNWEIGVWMIVKCM